MNNIGSVNFGTGTPNFTQVYQSGTELNIVSQMQGGLISLYFDDTSGNPIQTMKNSLTSCNLEVPIYTTQDINFSESSGVNFGTSPYVTQIYQSGPELNIVSQVQDGLIGLYFDDASGNPIQTMKNSLTSCNLEVPIYTTQDINFSESSGVNFGTSPYVTQVSQSGPSFDIVSQTVSGNVSLYFNDGSGNNLKTLENSLNECQLFVPITTNQPINITGTQPINVGTYPNYSQMYQNGGDRL